MPGYDFQILPIHINTEELNKRMAGSPKFIQIFFLTLH